MKTKAAIIFLVTLVTLAGCGGSKVFHNVRAGETLYRISKTYGVSIESIIAANDLRASSRLHVGQRLEIPDVDEEITGTRMSSTGRQNESKDGQGSTLALSWPIGGGSVTSEFGARNGSHHDGIDVSAPTGTAVLAAQDGDVIYSGVLRGYGNLVIVRHRFGFSTVYAHNQINLVQEGQPVRRGDMIARVGTTGHTSGANLHFEVRKDNVARNPFHFLPPAEQVAIRRNERGG